jgi:hypothetical protein
VRLGHLLITALSLAALVTIAVVGYVVVTR